MMTLHPSFRRLVLEHIPKLDREDLDNYDSLLALRLELVHRRSLVSGPPLQTNPDGQGPNDGSGPPKYGDDVEMKRRTPVRPKRISQGPKGTARETLDDLIDETTERANNIIELHRAQFDALHQLWSARRNLALHQGGILQIPTSWEGWKGFVGALRNYLLVQMQTFPVLATGRIKKPEFVGRWAAIAALVSILLYGISSLEKGGNGNNPPPPKDPDSTAVRQ